MKRIDPLFELIDSLTMSEKRFFKIFSQRHIIGNENEYLKLFNFIESSNEINMDELKSQPFVKNLSAEKNYLYRLILKSLNSYYYEFSNKMKVQNLITNAEILAYKGLENQALKLLIKAEKLSLKSELFNHLCLILQIKFEILSKQNKYKDALESLHKIKKTYNDINILTEVQTQASEIYNFKQLTGGMRSVDDLDKLNNTLTNINEHKNTSIKASLYTASILVTKAHANKNYTKEITLLNEIINLYENNYFLIELSVKGYINSLYNLANCYRITKKYSLSLKTLDKITSFSNHKLVTASKFLQAHSFYLNNNLKLYIFILKKEYKKAYDLHLSIKKYYKEYEPFLSKTTIYEHYLLLIRIDVELGQFKQALNYSNIIINDTAFKERQDISSYIRLLNLVIHFELNNDFTIENLSISAFYYLKRKKRLFKTEKLIVNFIGKYDKHNLNYLSRIHQKLIDLKKDPYEKSMFSFFDFENWVGKKLNLL